METESLDEFTTRLVAQTVDLDSLTKRAMAKHQSDRLCEKLLASNPARLLRKQYQDTLRCCFQLNEGPDNKIRSWGYCDRRHCITCNRIKTAQLIEAYLPVIQAMPAPHFVTLTVKNVPAIDLKATVKKMGVELARIINNSRMRRGNRVSLDGLRKLEITYNNNPSSPAFDTFHPHFHVIVASSMDGEQLLMDWLQNAAFPIDWKGQDLRPADENSVMELFKYVSKLHFKAAKNDPESDARGIEAVDTIMQAVQGVQLFKAFGNVYGTKVKPEPPAGGGVSAEQPVKRYTWNSRRGHTGHDWEESVWTTTVQKKVVCVAESDLGNDYEVQQFEFEEFVPTGRLLTGFKPRAYNAQSAANYPSPKEAYNSGGQSISEAFGLEEFF